MKKGLIVILSILFQACSYSDPLNLPGLDGDGFKNDRGGCEGNRQKQIELIKAYKDQFLGISENQIFKAIGRYDYQVLDKKNEKIFVYFLEPGSQCEHMQNPTEAESLVLYMNAVKLVKQVVIRKGGHLVEP
jgi:hypothetical protein